MEVRGRCVDDFDFSEVMSGSEDEAEDIVDSVADSVGLSGEGRRIRGDGMMMVRVWSKVENRKSTFLGAEIWYLVILFFWVKVEV